MSRNNLQNWQWSVGNRKATIICLGLTRFLLNITILQGITLINLQIIPAHCMQLMK